MRKRSEAMAEQEQQAPQQEKRDEFFDEGKPKPPPEPSTDARASVAKGKFTQEGKIQFVRCECGLNQSLVSAKGKDPALLECLRCRKPLGTLAEAEAALSGAAPQDAGEAEACATCGKPVTVSAVGKFWPCGHSPRAIEAAKKAEQALGAVTKIAHDPNAFLDAPTKDQERAQALYVDAKVPSVKVTLPVDEKVAQSNIAGHNNIVRAPREGVITLTRGKMLFTPISFNTFEVGPFSATVGEDQTPEEVMEALKTISERAHEDALRQYIEFVQKNSKAIDQLAKDRGIK